MLDIPIGMMSRLICRLLVFTKSMLKGVSITIFSHTHAVSDCDFCDHSVRRCDSCCCRELFLLFRLLSICCIDLLQILCVFFLRGPQSNLLKYIFLELWVILCNSLKIFYKTSDQKSFISGLDSPKIFSNEVTVYIYSLNKQSTLNNSFQLL